MYWEFIRMPQQWHSGSFSLWSSFWIFSYWPCGMLANVRTVVSFQMCDIGHPSFISSHSVGSHFFPATCQKISKNMENSCAFVWTLSASNMKTISYNSNYQYQFYATLSTVCIECFVFNFHILFWLSTDFIMYASSIKHGVVV